MYIGHHSTFQLLEHGGPNEEVANDQDTDPHFTENKSHCCTKTVHKSFFPWFFRRWRWALYAAEVSVTCWSWPWTDRTHIIPKFTRLFHFTSNGLQCQYLWYSWSVVAPDTIFRSRLIFQFLWRIGLNLIHNCFNLQVTRQDSRGIMEIKPNQPSSNC